MAVSRICLKDNSPSEEGLSGSNEGPLVNNPDAWIVTATLNFC